MVVVPAELKEINPGPGHQRARPCPDLDPNAGSIQGVKVGPDLDQTPGRDVKQNQETDQLQKVPGVPAELEEINPGQGPDLHPSHLTQGNLKCLVTECFFNLFLEVSHI